MDQSQRFLVAGDAATLIEAAGFTAVARLKDGIVTIEFWGPGGGLRRVIHEDAPNAENIADECIAALGGPKPPPRGELS